jgi:Asp-tRNA(Asn)/Glu-tRNA(Gln) amidotransferase A subunit family amidase
MISHIQTKPIVKLARDLRSGDLAPDAYLDHLESVYIEREPSVLAFIPEAKRFNRLRDEAKTLVASYPDPLARPPLFCIPVGIKDIFHVERFDTKAGSELPASVLKGREATSVRALREAGALIMGKTVTTEFAYFAPGPTRNPHSELHTPGGSSSGSAAAVAAGLCPISSGTQTIGSIIRPASYCGIVGYKPSYDRVSRAGVIPLSPSLDHIGVFSTDISGVDLAASVLCPDWQIAVSDRLPILGVPDGPYLEHVSAQGISHFEETLSRLSGAGYGIKYEAAFAEFDEIATRHRKILAAEAAEVHADWYAEYGHLYDKRTQELIEKGFKVTVGELAEALTSRERLRRDLISQMDRTGIDLWVSPSAKGTADKGIHATGDPILNLPWTHAGLPAVNLPSGFSSDGLPLGLQLVGRWYGDEVLLEWAADLERVLIDNG